MNRILSQEEIDVLLASAATAVGRDGEVAGVPFDVTTGSVAAYDFRRPDRVSKDQIRSLQFIHDRFARNLSTSLSAYLRTVTEATIVSVEQCAYSEFLMSLPDVTAYYALSLSRDLVGALELNSEVAYTMIDRMLGGNGTAAIPARALTEIEQNVVDAAVKLILENLTETWTAIVERVEFTIQARETRPQMLQVVAPNEIVLVLAFDVKVGEARGMLNLCVPASVIELAGSNLARTWQRSHRAPTTDDEQRLLNVLARVPLPVSARLETRLSASDLVNLRVGDILALGQSARAPIEVLIGSTPKFRGHLAEHDGRGVLAIAEPIVAPHLIEVGR
jgi:flagellar motor switch protein FliM